MPIYEWLENFMNIFFPAPPLPPIFLNIFFISNPSCIQYAISIWFKSPCLFRQLPTLFLSCSVLAFTELVLPAWNMLCTYIHRMSRFTSLTLCLSLYGILHCYVFYSRTRIYPICKALADAVLIAGEEVDIPAPFDTPVGSCAHVSVPDVLWCILCWNGMD